MPETKLRLILESIWKGKGVQNANNDLGNLQKSAQKGAGGLNALGLASGIVGGAVVMLSQKIMGAVGSIKNLAVESALLNARYNTMGVVLDNLGKNVGMSKKEMKNLELALEDTGISMIKSRESIARLIQAEIDLSSATGLARVAQDGAVIANTNSSESFSRLITFITTGNTRIARTLGLFINLKAGYKKWAEANDRTVESLTELEKVQIRTNLAVEAGSKISGTYEAAMKEAGKQLLSLERDVENFKVTLGGLAREMLSSSVPAARKFTQEMTTLVAAMDKLQGNLPETVEHAKILDIALQGLGIDASMVRDAWNKLTEAAEEYTTTEIIPTLNTEQVTLIALGNAITGVSEDMGALESATSATVLSLQSFTAASLGAQAVRDLNALLNDGKISQEDYDLAMSVVGTSLLGLTTKEVEAASTVRDLTQDLAGGAIKAGEYVGALGDVGRALSLLDGQSILVQFNFTGDIPNFGDQYSDIPSSRGGTVNQGGGGSKKDEFEGAAGGSFVVPPGFPNDSFRMGVSSGERVQVQTGQMQGGDTRIGEGMVVNINNQLELASFESLFREMVGA